jgi:hypothetical protein
MGVVVEQAQRFSQGLLRPFRGRAPEKRQGRHGAAFDIDDLLTFWLFSALVSRC